MSNADKRYNVIFPERAGEMLVQHARFLAQVNTRAADKLRADVVEAAKSLQEFPDRGSRLTHRLLPTNKYIVDKRYLLIYQIKDGTVYIDYIVDCRRDYAWLM